MLSKKAMRLLALPLVAVAVLAGVLFAGLTSSSAQDEPKLDHFTCYPVTSAPLDKPVTIRDQFESISARVRGARHLCAPTHKNGEDINDPAAHLMCHAITAPDPPFEPRTVRVTNQFTKGDELRVTSRDSLCMPAIKSLTRPPSDTAPLPNISHYKCYVAQRTSSNPPFASIKVALFDQFGNSRPSTQRPTRLCNPASKNDERTPTDEHLVCYPVQLTGFVRDQFGVRRAVDIMRRLLCVPSTKTVVS